MIRLNEGPHLDATASGRTTWQPIAETAETEHGRVIAGGGKIDLLEGDPMPEGIFIIEFQTADAARRWYQSDDYQEALKVRLSSSRGRVFLIEGNEISSAVPVAGLDAGKN
jgi:uncharacterized protein (DUF1330 family)